MKFFLIFSLCLISFNSMALEPHEYLGSSRTNQQKEISVQQDPDSRSYLGSKREEAKQRHMGKAAPTQPRFTRERTYLYFRSGLSLGELTQERKKLGMYSLGVKRTAGSTYYGLEYSNYKVDEDKSYQIQLQYGWMPQRDAWDHRIVPYVGLMAGYGSTEASSVKLNSGDGIAISIDAGIEIWRNLMFNMTTGVKSTWVILEDQNSRSQQMLDLYFSFGFRF